MKKKSKSTLAILMAVAMMSSLCSEPAAAAETEAGGIVSETSVNTFHMLYKATKDVSFLYHVNNETCTDSKVTGVYFLSGNGQQTDANNYIYVFASAVISDSEDSRTVYFAFSYSTERGGR